MRPKPVISEHLVESTVYRRASVRVYPSNEALGALWARELWLNVRNDGKTPIKNMRARVKLHVMPSSAWTGSRTGVFTRPPNMSDEEWQKNRIKEAIIATDQFFFGSAVPFVKGTPFAHTPRSTSPVQWTVAGNELAWIIDLPPKSDEASVRIVLLCEYAKTQNARLAKLFGFPEADKPDNPNNILVQTCNVSEFDHKRDFKDDSTSYDYAIKFWVIADNLTKEYSEVVHVRIPNTLDRIDYELVKKGTPEHVLIEKMFQTSSFDVRE